MCCGQDAGGKTIIVAGRKTHRRGELSVFRQRRQQGGKTRSKSRAMSGMPKHEEDRGETDNRAQHHHLRKRA
jgi:hypothetical protein